MEKSIQELTADVNKIADMIEDVFEIEFERSEPMGLKLGPHCLGLGYGPKGRNFIVGHFPNGTNEPPEGLREFDCLVCAIGSMVGMFAADLGFAALGGEEPKEESSSGGLNPLEINRGLN